jgi:D-sedoheptulose 7-phosphate isomerase
MPADLKRSILRKSEESAVVKNEFFSANADRLIECCQVMARAFDKGAKLLVMGNGGSFCDAQHVAVEFMHPIIEKRKPFPAIAVATDAAFLTAIGNDQDFSFVFSKQLRMLGGAGDVALGISTSGKSSSVNRAMQAAREMKMLTIGFSGKDGGKLGELCDFCFTVPSFSIHRIQETHETLFHIMWDLIHVIQGEEDVI